MKRTRCILILIFSFVLFTIFFTGCTINYTKDIPSKIGNNLSDKFKSTIKKHSNKKNLIMK